MLPLQVSSVRSRRDLQRRTANWPLSTGFTDGSTGPCWTTTCGSWYETLEVMQTDLDAYLLIYNTKRPHRDRGMNGRTPYAVFRAGIPERPRRRGRVSSEYHHCTYGRLPIVDSFLPCSGEMVSTTPGQLKAAILIPSTTDPQLSKIPLPSIRPHTVILSPRHQSSGHPTSPEPRQCLASRLHQRAGTSPEPPLLRS